MSKAQRRILFIAREHEWWTTGGTPDYPAQLGFEDGFLANGAEFTTITTPWFRQARELCAGKKFDQVWLELYWNNYDADFLDWLCGLAPVRVGWIAETLNHSDEELANEHVGGGHSYIVQYPEAMGRLARLTHALTYDEADVRFVENRFGIPGMWWPGAVPKRFVCSEPPAPRLRCATFMGSLYEERAELLKHPAVRGLLVHLPPRERHTVYPQLFRAIHRARHVYEKTGLPFRRTVLNLYLWSLRRVRRGIHWNYFRGLQQGMAVVNLRSRVRAYPCRVVEGMAAGRPVISWEVPDRPQLQSLFQEEREILFYRDGAAGLAETISRLMREPDLAHRIVQNARRKVVRFHTMEQRVGDVLRWIDTGERPRYQ